MKILVTGSREFTDAVCIREALLEYAHDAAPGEVLLYHGAARGADSLADGIGRELGFDVYAVAPAYDRFGPEIAPLIRNSVLVGERPDICLAFYKASARNVGTRDCVVKCRAAKIPVREYERP